MHATGPVSQRLHLTVDGRGHVVEEQLRSDTEQDREKHQRRGDRQFTRRDRRQMVAMGTFVFRTEIDPLDRPEDIGRSEDHRERGDRRQHTAVVPAREGDEHLADEAAETREAEAGEEDSDGQAAVDRHAAEDATELLEIAMVHPVVQHAHHKEHAGRTDAVREHLEHGAVDALRPGIPTILMTGDGAPDTQAQHHVAHVADGTVGHHPLEVFLGQGSEGTIHHRHDAQTTDEPGQREACARTDRVADAKDAIPAELEEHAGQDHRDRRRCLHVRVGQPCVHRHNGHLDHEADEQKEERPCFKAHAPDLSRCKRRVWQLADLREGQDVERVERPLSRADRLNGGGTGRSIQPRAHNVGGDELLVREQSQIARVVEHQDGQQHEHAAEERVEEKLDGGILAPRTAPDADEEIHRQQHHLPEHIKEEKVERHEDAQHAGDEQQKQDVIGLDVLGDRPARGRGQHRQERGQHDQREADAVNSQQVFDAEGLDPGQFDDRLHRRITEPELRRPRRPEERRNGHPQRQHEHNGGGDQRGPADEVLASLRHDRQRQKRRHEGGQEDDGRQGPEGGLDERISGRHGKVRQGIVGCLCW